MTKSWSSLWAAKACSIIAIAVSLLAFAYAANAANSTNTPAGDVGAENTGQPPANVNELQEVVVTAQRRRQDLVNVPISVVAISNETLTQLGTSQLSDLVPLAPGLYIFQGDLIPQFTLRGVGSGSYNQNTASTVGVYLDQVDLAAPMSQVGQIFDLERVEVLNGPQGTLWGRNTTGGAINFVTRRPDGTTEADSAFTVGRWGEFDFDGGAQTAITNNLSIRAAADYNYSDGYGLNLLTQRRVNGQDSWGTRLGLVYKTDNVDAYLSLFANDTDKTGQYADMLGLDPKTGAATPNNENPKIGYIYPTELDVYAGRYLHNDTRNTGGTLNATFDFGGGYTITSITGLLRSINHTGADYGEAPVPVADIPVIDVQSRQESEEVHVASPNTGPWTWIAGVSYLHLWLQTNALVTLAVLDVPTIGETDTETDTSYAGFFDTTFALGGGFKITGGIRVTHDESSMHFQSYDLSLVGPFDTTKSKSWTEPTYRGVLSYNPNLDTMFYASYAHGYREGSFDSGLKTSPDQLNPTNPEFVNSYEVGVKGLLFDRRLRIAADFYYMEFTDMQLDALAPYVDAICCSIVNAGRSHIYGPEVTASALLASNFSIDFTGTIITGKITEFDDDGVNYNGIRLGWTPTYQVRVAPEYRIPYQGGNFFVAPQVRVSGSYRVTVTPDTLGRDNQHAYTTIDGQVGYRADKWSVFGWIRNANDYRALESAHYDASLGYAEQFHSPPMSFGITATARF